MKKFLLTSDALEEPMVIESESILFAFEEIKNIIPQGATRKLQLIAD